MSKAKGRKKLYIIGIDAAPLWLLKEYQDKGGMFGLSRFLKLNQISDLESTMPPLTGPSWPSMYTGLDPGEHGVPDFFVLKKDYVKDIAYYDSSKYQPFWNLLAEKGYKCLVITPAMGVLLSEHKNIDMITGFPLKSRADNNDLKKAMKKYDFYGEPDIEKDMNFGKISTLEASKRYVKSVKSRSEITKEMISKRNYDLVYVCFTETDRMQHFAMNKSDKDIYILPIYREIARFLEYIQKRVDEENALLLIASDHGAQPIHNKFLINKWMIDNGYASLKETVMYNIKNLDNKVSRSYSLREFLLKTHLRKAYDVMPYLLKRVANRLVGALLSSASSGSYTRLHIFDFDMNETKAFAEVSNNPVATVWINDGRFSSGIVSKKEKEKLKKTLIRKLKEVKSKEGDKMFISISDSSFYYKNTSKFIPPDLFVEAKKGYTIDIFNFSLTNYFMKPELAKSGDHTRKGIFGFYSRLYRIDMSNMKVTDVAQIVLDYFGLKRRRRSRLFEGM